MFGLKKYCPICGITVSKEASTERFGKYLCSDEHAKQYTERRMEEEKRMSEERRNSRERVGGCC